MKDTTSLRKALCLMEQHCSSREFYLELMDCSSIDWFGALHPDVVLVVGKLGNPPVPKKLITGWALALLRNPFVEAVVRRNPLCIENGAVRPLWNRESDSGQTVVVDAEHHLFFVFEAGHHYIRLVTVCGTDQSFTLRKGARALKVWPSGLVRAKNIPELGQNQKRQCCHPLHHRGSLGDWGCPHAPPPP